MKPKQIALVHDFLFTFGGAERVLLQLHELYPEAPIYTLFADPKIIKTYFPKARVITSYLQKNPLRKKPWMLLTAMPLALESFTFNKYDTVISSSGAFSHGIITGAETRHISYCHSPMRYVWDWHNEYLAEHGATGLISSWFARGILSRLRNWDVVSSKRVDIWIANSSVVANRIAKFYRQESTVIHPPILSGYFTHSLTPLDKREAYFVTASRLTPNKRIDLIIDACAKAKVPLTVIGEGSDRSRLEGLARKAGGNITFTGYLSEEKKQEVIGKARGFIQAAEEDFGLSAAESLGLGTPVLSFYKGGITDLIAKGKNGETFAEAEAKILADSLSSFKISLSAEEIRKSVESLKPEIFQEKIREIAHHA